jgi:hypothetical protein
MTEVTQYLVCLFRQTRDGEAVLYSLRDAGVPHDCIEVIGDLGAAAGQEGAEEHTTLDRLHIPLDLRALFMDTIRAGGVVLAADATSISAEEVTRSAREHNVLRVERTSSSGHSPSHNHAG